MNIQKKNERAILDHIARVTARTVRAIEKEFGTDGSCASLVTNGDLYEVPTCYGPVLTPTPQTLRRLGRSTRIMSPDALADVAYLRDAIARLTKEGYTPMEHDPNKGRTARPFVLHSRIRMRVPFLEQSRIRTFWKTVVPDDFLHELPVEEAGGHPWLYAHASGGGIDLGALKRLVAHHQHDIDVWRSPLLVAVPDMQGMLPYLSRLEAATEKMWLEDRPRLEISWYDRLRVIEQPLPPARHR